MCSWDNICGFDNSNRNTDYANPNAGLDMTGRDHQYFTDPSDPQAMTLCVAECPSGFADTLGAAAFEHDCKTSRSVACPTDGSNFTVGDGVNDKCKA